MLGGDFKTLDRRDWEMKLGMSARLSITAAVLAAVLAGAAPVARAGERVALRNGYEMECDHHVEVEGRVRLYLNAGEDNYIELAPQQIATVAPAPNANLQGTAQDMSVSSLKPGVAKRSAAGTPARLSESDLGEILMKAGQEHNLDVDLLASLVKAESGGNAKAVSRAGARGLMQLMPATAATLGVGDSFKPEENVRGGSVYLDSLLTRYHDNLALALAAYNAGPLAVDKYHGIPPYRETQAYVARVIHEFNRRVMARDALARQSLAATGPEGKTHQ
jgi:soluble lytic murein transglycosylase-like protein